MEEQNKPIIGITHGDINGISYEIILKALRDNRILDFCTPVIYGSPKVAAYHRKALKISNINVNNIRKLSDINPKRINIINCISDNVRVELGKSTQMAGKSSFEALEKAMADLKSGDLNILVTAPINKENIKEAGFQFPGHTEYLSSNFDSDVIMLMIKDNLRIGVVTGHIPVKEVSQNISIEKIVKKLKLINQSLIDDFGIRKPVIAVLGLNPHASDNGVIGNEENNLIIPAIQQAKIENIMAMGPYPADGFFTNNEYIKFDAILAMYHDQGLIPFKILSSGEGVNYTAGLPIIRTSPAHGTAYDIAGASKASPESFRQAIYHALDILKNREMLKGIEPLPIQTDKQNISYEDEE